ncbi:EamA family transporter [Rhizobium sp. SSA_523]|uniref:DMT family transporter n=1 Tax=Rhizobium sp. SSA_523 TaxID=2952477 RepID=UPI002090E844|nr:EamA family transporter [Rhizobium sp. SSA_523]MCO5731615.1 EamA family transporter [Rhizobium sp. SSA_523]WKC21873.1 EamA family transporter [Rhizobium sp. SSA_523]
MRPVFKSRMFDFVLLCLIWGSTWIAIKAGIHSVPPMFFAGSRFTVAGILLLLIGTVRREPLGLTLAQLPRLLVISLLMISLCYGPLFWGMQYVNSGTAAVLELSLTPIALMCFALLLGEERWQPSKAGAIALGVMGLGLLYGPEAMSRATGDATAGQRLWGIIAIAAAAFTYGLGSVLAKPLLREHPPFQIAGATTAIGGLFLLCYSLLVEDAAWIAVYGRWGVGPWLAWGFLVLFGSLIGYTIFMRLLRDIGPSKAGSYAFVSPIVAVLLGEVWLGEEVSLLDLAAMTLMMMAAYLALRAEDSSALPAKDAMEDLPDGRPVRKPRR